MAGLNKEVVSYIGQKQGHTSVILAPIPRIHRLSGLAQTVATVWRNIAGLGILVCSSGVGMSIAANKVPGIRAALVSDEKPLRSPQHNDANVLCLGSKRLSAMTREKLSTLYQYSLRRGRHERRSIKLKPLTP